MVDVIIVGAGTAGLSAAIYTVRAGKKALVIEAASYGGQIINTPDIENYPGIAHISGFDFATGLYNQAKDLGAEIKFERVTEIVDKGSIKLVKTSQGEYECKAVILATGAKNRPLGLSNEKELVGKGVSYPFGFGLSYTDFEYEKPVVRANGNGFSATITVKNTGNNPGKEVVEIYVKAPEGGLEKPFVELKGFAKTRLLLPGESETITIMVDNYSLASFNESVSAWESASGQYSVFFASSVADFRAEGRYRLRNKYSYPVHKCLLPQEKINVITIH